MNTFESLLAGLSRAGVDFIVTGGLAVAMAGFARVTEDVDLLVEASEDNLRRLIDSLATFGEGAASELTPADFPVEEGCVRIAENFDVDVFTLMKGATYHELMPLARRYVVEGEPVLFLSAEGLLRLKRDSLRPKDRLDVQALRQILAERESE